MKHFTRKHAAATLEYVMLIVIILGAAILSRDYISRAIFGKWKTSMDSLSFGRQYDPKKTLECAFDPATGIWYDIKCAEAIVCALADTSCLFDRVNQCSPKCIDNEKPPACSRRTLCDLAPPAECGDVDDNCGGILHCPLECPNSGDICNPVTHRCDCAPKTACGPGDCGDVSNGCGTGTLPCGSCSVGTCVNNRCCVPRTTCIPGECGDVSDGCGTGTIPCGNCSVGVCINNQCCVPRTTCNPGECENVNNGCQGTLSCGSCPSGQRCNASHQCECAPRTTCNPGECGDASDGCFGTLPCGSCSVGTCVDNQCCVPRTTCNPGECSSEDLPDPDDGCGGTLSCPDCPGLQRCIIDAFDNHTCCTPLRCTPGRCGVSADNCQGTLDCGPCPSPSQVCSVFNPELGIPGNECCIPETDEAVCSRLGIQCGPASGTDNNCGQVHDVAECGPCSSPQVCSIPGQQCCSPESDAAFCSRSGIQCGGAQGTDNCGHPRTVTECGPCSSPQVCSIPGQQCCSPESDTAFCSRTGIQCGQASGTDNCGHPRTVAECGPCSLAQQVCFNRQCCLPRTTCNSGECGNVSDGCGGTLTCPDCAAGQQCQSGQCVPCVCNCNPLSSTSVVTDGPHDGVFQGCAVDVYHLWSGTAMEQATDCPHHNVCTSSGVSAPICFPRASTDNCGAACTCYGFIDLSTIGARTDYYPKSPGNCPWYDPANHPPASVQETPFYCD